MPSEPKVIQVDFPRFRPGAVVGVGAILVLLMGLWTAYYTIPAESVGMVLRFGKHIKTVDPGLRFKLPFGMDRVYTLPVKRQLKQEFGFGTKGATNVSQFSKSRELQQQERSMVTGDLNSAEVEWVIQYRIRDPELFLFKVRNPEETLRDASESVMREVVGDRTVDSVITVGRNEIESDVLQKLQDICNKYEMGLSIDQVQLKDVNPPREVKASFNEVNEAKQEREKLINVANGDYNREVPKAEGTADQKIQEAEGYALKRVNEAEGDAGRFKAFLAEYLKAPEVTRQRIYLETMAEVLPMAGPKIIVDDQAKQVLPLLQLDGKEILRK